MAKQTKKTRAKGSGAALKKLKQQKAVIEARIQKVEAAFKVRERKQDKQRKFLVGEHCFNQAIKDGTLNELKKMMRAALKRESDRALFEE